MGGPRGVVEWAVWRAEANLAPTRMEGMATHVRTGGPGGSRKKWKARVRSWSRPSRDGRCKGATRKGWNHDAPWNGRWNRCTRTHTSQEEAAETKPKEKDEVERKKEVEIVKDGEADAGSVLRLGALVGVACAFGVGVGATMGAKAGQEYFAGYLLEQSLSVDNLFVFVLIFKYFQVPLVSQKKILDYGIYSAAVLRLIMILLGSELINLFEPVLLLFAGILIYSAYGILVGGENEEEDLSRNVVVRLFGKFFQVSDEYDGDRFFTMGRDGIRKATPLLVALATIEFSDVVFAVDSIPAVFGVTRDPFIVYSSNMFAIASLRSLFTFVATAVEELRFLQASVALVLGFIGVKMVVEFFGVDVPTEVSLAMVLILLSGGVVASLLFPEPSVDEEAERMDLKDPTDPWK